MDDRLRGVLRWAYQQHPLQAWLVKHWVRSMRLTRMAAVMFWCHSLASLAQSALVVGMLFWEIMQKISIQL